MQFYFIRTTFITGVITQVLSLLLFLSCNHQAKQEQQLLNKPNGVYIDTYPRHGQSFQAGDSINNSYRYFKVNFKNDSTRPLHIQLAFPDSVYESVPANGTLFRVFVLPADMTMQKHEDRIYFDRQITSFLAGDEMKQTNADLILMPEEETSFVIGFITHSNGNLEPNPIELFQKGQKNHCTEIPRGALGNVKDNDGKFPLFVGMDFKMFISEKSHALIRCGEMWFE